MRYLKSEHLKFKRTILNKLLWIAPLFTAIFAWIVGGFMGFQYMTFYWWYAFLLPGTTAILCVLAHQKEERAGKYYSIRSLPIDLAKFEIAKCPFKLTRNSVGFSGEWSNERSTLKVDLRETSRLSDGVLKGETEELDIPFWGQTKKHTFIGVYIEGEEGIVINKVNVIDKASGKLIQVIDPQLNGCKFGSYMTSIFQNLENDGEQIRLNCYSIGPDISVNYIFNNQTQKYDILTE